VFGLAATPDSSFARVLAGAPAATVYDTDALGSPFRTQLGEVWRLRRLLRILVARDVILRYKRSLLGVWWTLLNPLLTMLVLWAVLSGVFHSRAIGVPYIVYLLSGIIVMNFFQQAVLTAGLSIVSGSGVLSRVHVPPQLFALSAVLAAGVTFIAGLAVLIVIQLATGVGVRVTALLVPIPMLGLLMLGTGAGLLLAAVAVRMHDVIDFTAVLLQLTAFVTPTFYALSAVSQPVRTVIEANPLTQILLLLRALLYGGTLPVWWTWLVALGAGAALLAIGSMVLARTWRVSVAML
jgi:ABC-type polysaccharide/polyol phosphate export permease